MSAKLDERPVNCRFRFKDEGKPYGKSGCRVVNCGGSLTPNAIIVM